MYQLTDRCKALRQEVVNKKSYMYKYWAQRNVYFTLGVASTKGRGLSNEEVIAEGLSNVLNCFKPFIAPGELIAGFNYGDAHMEEKYLPKEDESGIQAMKDNGFTEEEIRRYFAVRDHAYEEYQWAEKPVFTEAEIQLERERALRGRCIDANHTVIGYEKVVNLGFEGLLREVEQYEAFNGEHPFYKGIKKLCKAAFRMGEAYAEEAERLLRELSGEAELKCLSEGENTRKKQEKEAEQGIGELAYRGEDLKTIAEVCRRVPRYPARTFMEAVQSLWFAHVINTWEDHINANSLGHLDQILYPYYKADLEAGRITREEAFEIICCLWLKLYRDYDVQQSCIGGTSKEGKSLVNELSYMMLDATEQLDFIRCLSVRYSSVTEKVFLKRALEVVGHVQKGVPFFFNDDVMVPALMSKGIAEEDAYDYTQIGCVETVIPGKSNPHAVTGETNLLKSIEYVLGNGQSLMYPQLASGLKTGELKELDTFERFLEAIKQQIGHILDLTCSKVVKLTAESYINAPKPYKSLLTEGCLESGLDFNKHGALYDFYQIMLGGVPNLADSLAVIKKFVYEEQKYSLAELKEILLNDFPDEAVRMEFINKAPKFGNDIDEVDDLACEIIDYSCDVLDRLSEVYGFSFHAQPFTFLWMVEHGRTSAASADGRHKGEIIAYSVSPMQGRDFSGLTAVLNSISKLPTKRTPGTTSAIVEVDPKLFTDANIDTLTDILVASSRKGLSNVQFNTIDAETLTQAQKNPEKYNNLAVRVSGFSQKFNLISPELQNHIIGRTKHECL